ncbi:hypothetical protein BX616_003411 [Lobosporangium transversale]|nr:hypothetical protein BX616_003411 [Lobosporangium transversale]
MGNSKSRHAAGGHSKSRSKHSKFQSGSSNILNNNSHNDNNDRRGRASKYTSSNHSNPQAPLPNDSGHYSIHGFTAPSSSPLDRPETPVGLSSGLGGGMGTGPIGLAWNHPNLSSPGRLDQHKTSFESNQFQYGSKMNNHPFVSGPNNPPASMAGAGASVVPANGHPIHNPGSRGTMQLDENGGQYSGSIINNNNINSSVRHSSIKG